MQYALLAPREAVVKYFCNKAPHLTTNNWKVGHIFGASGMLSVELAILMLQHNKCIGTPFSQCLSTPEKVKNILVNAVGFGGNAVLVLLSI